MQNNNILFIVEGEHDEVKFLKKIFETCRRNGKYSTYTYKTTIHKLAQVLTSEYPDFDSDEVDIKLVLKSHETTESKKSILSKRYKDVFLIFDLDPHHDTPHFDILKRMISFFDDSTSRGKLYINYPMIQSYKHFSKLPDDLFKEKKIRIDDIGRYKQIVGEESAYKDLTLYTYSLLISLTVHHLRKANYILNNKYKTPSMRQYCRYTGKDIYESQFRLMNDSSEVYILNTCIFNLIDYAPESFFRQIKTHPSKFYI